VENSIESLCWAVHVTESQNRGNLNCQNKTLQEVSSQKYFYFDLFLSVCVVAWKDNLNLVILIYLINNILLII